MSGGEWLRTGNGAKFRAFFYRPSIPQLADGGGRTVSSDVWKGGRKGGANSLRGRTTGGVRGTSHLDIMSPISPTWSIVMCSKSTGGVHCWWYARAHDLLWWPTSSMSSPLSKLRIHRTAVGLFEDSAQIAGPAINGRPSRRDMLFIIFSSFSSSINYLCSPTSTNVIFNIESCFYYVHDQHWQWEI